MIPRPENPLIVALDVSDARSRRARSRRALAPEVGMLKVGLELALGGRSRGRAADRRLTRRSSWTRSCTTSRTRSSGRRPTSRASACAMVNVHALGGEAMMRAARTRGRPRRESKRACRLPLVIAVTVLSSQSRRGAREPRVARVRGEVARAATVSSCRERTCDDVRAVCGDDVLSRGARASVPRAATAHDQVRVLTPAAAIERGADYLVVGRPITDADDPVGVARAILREVALTSAASARDAEPAGSASMFALCRARGAAYTRRVPDPARSKGARDGPTRS